MKKMQTGLIGLATMGQNLVLNLESKGYSTVIYNRTSSVTEKFMKERAAAGNIQPAYSLDEFVDLLEKPRKIILMVKAGDAVDGIINSLSPLLEEGDIILDGGNSHFRDTERRQSLLREKGIHLLGVGISGGEEGALRGPCIMPGGDRNAYEKVRQMLEDISANVDGTPCCAYMGTDGAGHFVKTVHNGIEYGVMQLIAECYDYLRQSLDFKPDKISEIFAQWNNEETKSYLLEISAEILKATDRETGEPLVNVILDKAQQKGTGKWVAEVAIELGVPATVIEAGISARALSAYKNERMAASSLLFGPGKWYQGMNATIIEAMKDALYCSMLTAYNQGFQILAAGSKEFGYGLKLNEIAQIWQGGCIIRAGMLEPIKQAFEKNSEFPNLYLDEHFKSELNLKQGSWRLRVIESFFSGISTPATSAGLLYYDGYRAKNLPANLVQAQRDYFGAHTYERVDREGAFHTNWLDMSGITP
jgi:6-phosphogluconate dehydrogenase